MTARKLSSPTHVGACTRFVCWNDITTVRTIGYHENAPKTSEQREQEEEASTRPPLRTQVSGVRRAR